MRIFLLSLHLGCAEARFVRPRVCIFSFSLRLTVFHSIPRTSVSMCSCFPLPNQGYSHLSLSVDHLLYEVRIQGSSINCLPLQRLFLHCRPNVHPRSDILQERGYASIAKRELHSLGLVSRTDSRTISCMHLDYENLL